MLAEGVEVGLCVQDCSPESSADGAEPTAALVVVVVAGKLDMVMTERETLTPESLITMAIFLLTLCFVRRAIARLFFGIGCVFWVDAVVVGRR